jgi:hypothetical protein
VLTTTITVFSRDKAYSDALAILAQAHAEADSALADDLLSDARLYLAAQWNELQNARMARMMNRSESE